MNTEEIKKELFALLAARGARLMGVGDLRNVVADELTTGISVAVPVPKKIVMDLQTAPTKEYYDAYFDINAKLDEIIESGAEFLRNLGFHARANTTKVVKKDENWCTPLPHKTVATRAGLGWIGKSCLLVTKQYGSAVRISSLQTDAPLPADKPVNESLCGKCGICVQKCPAKALTGTLWNNQHCAGGSAPERRLPEHADTTDETGHRHRYGFVRPLFCRMPLYAEIFEETGRGRADLSAVPPSLCVDSYHFRDGFIPICQIVPDCKPKLFPEIIVLI